MGRKVERITVDMQAGRLPPDLERYRATALELGPPRPRSFRSPTSPWMSGWP